MFADITARLWEQPWGWHGVVFSSEFKWKCLKCGDTSLTCLRLTLSTHAVFAIFSVQSTIFAFSLCIKYLLYDMLCLQNCAAHCMQRTYLSFAFPVWWIGSDSNSYLNRNSGLDILQHKIGLKLQNISLHLILHLIYEI